MELSSGRIGITAPPPQVFLTLSGQFGFWSVIATSLHFSAMISSCIFLPSNHQAQTIPSRVRLPFSSVPGRALGLHSCEFTSTMSLSFVDHKIMNCLPAGFPSSSSSMTNHHHQSQVNLKIGGLSSSLHIEEKSPSNLSRSRSLFILFPSL